MTAPHPAPDPGDTTGPLPTHVAIIMDGNGRWARQRGLPRAAGHQQGARTVRRIIARTSAWKIPYLTLFGFSSENWRRPLAEVLDLMGILRLYLRREIDHLLEHDVRLVVIGDRTRLDPDIQELVGRAEERTAHCGTTCLHLALSYGGRADITQAVRALAEEVAAGRLDPAEVDEARINDRLLTRGAPDPDLMIRTSGEIRLSNFLLWQAAYAELVFSDTLWPDYTVEEFDAAIAAFQQRERRFGAVG